MNGILVETRRTRKVFKCKLNYVPKEGGACARNERASSPIATVTFLLLWNSSIVTQEGDTMFRIGVKRDESIVAMVLAGHSEQFGMLVYRYLPVVQAIARAHDIEAAASMEEREDAPDHAGLELHKAVRSDRDQLDQETRKAAGATRLGGSRLRPPVIDVRRRIRRARPLPGSPRWRSRFPRGRS